MMLWTGRMLWTFLTTVRWQSIFCCTDGGSQPSFFLRLSKRGLRYLVLRYRRLRRNSRRAEMLSTTSVRSSTSASNRTFFGVVADRPMCLLPASTPRETSWIKVLLVSVSLMVKGVLLTTTALPDFRSNRTFAWFSVGIIGCPVFDNT